MLASSFFHSLLLLSSRFENRERARSGRKRGIELRREKKKTFLSCFSSTRAKEKNDRFSNFSLFSLSTPTTPSLPKSQVWSTRSVDGVHRFLARSWRLTVQQESSESVEPTKDQLRLLHSTIRRVTDETDAMRFNTAISAMMEFVNGATKWEAPRPRSALRTFALLLAPYAPHLAEEAWAHLGGESFAALAPKERYEDGGSSSAAAAAASSSSAAAAASTSPYSTLAYAPWPVADESLLVSDSVTLPVQVNGKLRGSVELPAEGEGAGEAAATAAARAIPAVARLLGEEGATVAKVVFVPGRIINFIVVGKGGAGGGGKNKKKEKKKE